MKRVDLAENSTSAPVISCFSSPDISSKPARQSCFDSYGFPRGIKGNIVLSSLFLPSTQHFFTSVVSSLTTTSSSSLFLSTSSCKIQFSGNKLRKLSSLSSKEFVSKKIKSLNRNKSKCQGKETERNDISLQELSSEEAEVSEKTVNFIEAGEELEDKSFGGKWRENNSTTELIDLPVREVFAKEGDQTPGEKTKLFVSGQKKEKQMCYYFSQGRCKLDGDAAHMANYSHTLPSLDVNPSDTEKVVPQPFDKYLVLDLEGRVEILEFPCLLVDPKTLQIIDCFHRFVRPVKMSVERQKEYIKGKYGPWGLERVWHDTAIPFTEVLSQFENWMESHGLWEKHSSKKLKRAAFVTCGNWDIKTKIPEQCVDSGVPLPPYFTQWINLKDIYLNHYQRRAGGMLSMLQGLHIPLSGTHHVGLDDAHNISRVLQRMLIQKAVVKVTAERYGPKSSDVRFMFKWRIK